MDSSRYGVEFFKACTGRRDFEGWRSEFMMDKDVMLTTPICNIMGQDITYDVMFGTWDDLTPLGNIIVELIKFENQPRHCDCRNDIKAFVEYGQTMCGDRKNG